MEQQHPLWSSLEPGFGLGNRPTRLDRGACFELLRGSAWDTLGWSDTWRTWTVGGAPVFTEGLATELSRRGYDVAPAVAREVWEYILKLRTQWFYQRELARKTAEAALAEAERPRLEAERAARLAEEEAQREVRRAEWLASRALPEAR